MEREDVLIPATFFLPPLLYAETHYRFPYFISFLRKSEPEIIADAPHRIEPGSKLPILVLVKDADNFPTTLESVDVQIRKDGRILQDKDLLGKPVELRRQFWWRVFEVVLRGETGWVEVDVRMSIARDGKKKSYRNDNHRTSSHKPLRVYVSKDPLPRMPGLLLGECHAHTERTSDQVEFGSPLEASRSLAGSLGLSFFCATDHSYDLDDSIASYLVNDPATPKWKDLQAAISRLNGIPGPVIVRGEEVTCRNTRGRNVHLLLLGAKRFTPGSGDGAEQWLRTRSEHSAQEVLERMEPQTVAFAAHAREPVPMIQRLLLGRGEWGEDDLRLNRLRGIQFANGKQDEGFRDGYRTWIRLLLEGRKAVTIAGNDAHGNFNRFRQIGIPFFSIVERGDQMFGVMRTGIFTSSKTEAGILQALRRGACIISDGPVANLTRPRDRSQTALGTSQRGRSIALDIHAVSTREYGPIQTVTVFSGSIGGSSEQVVARYDGHGAFSLFRSMRTPKELTGYVRVEVSTSAENEAGRVPHFCYTNPVWINC